MSDHALHDAIVELREAELKYYKPKAIELMVKVDRLEELTTELEARLENLQRRHDKMWNEYEDVLEKYCRN